MKIATKLTAGYGILIAVLIAVLAYQVSLVHTMKSINRDLSQMNFRTSMISLQLLRDVDQIEEYTRKFFITKDSGYARRLTEIRESFQKGLSEVTLLGQSPQVSRALSDLSLRWESYSLAAAGLESRLGAASAEEAGGLLDRQVDLFDGLRAQTREVFDASQQAIGAQVRVSTETAGRAERVSWVAGIAALVLSCLVLLLIVRSIAAHLGRLTAGTRAIAEGNFDYQLDSRRDDEFGSLARSFNSMTRRLGELDQMKKDFVSYVSHELKAPLASIHETIQLMLDEIPGPLTDKQRRLLDLNIQSARRLAAMIGNLLDVSRMEAGVVDYTFAQHDLVAVVRSVLARIEGRIREKALRLEASLPSQPLKVDCDEDRIVQVIDNLLDNALKFSPDGETLRVSVSRVGEVPKQIPGAQQKAIRTADDGFAIVSISDAGPGVPEFHKEKIFEKFHQVKQGGKISGQGVGLGLAICRSILDAHEGAIWAEDHPGGGSKFCFLLRVSPAAGTAPETLSAAAG